MAGGRPCPATPRHVKACLRMPAIPSQRKACPWLVGDPQQGASAGNRLSAFDELQLSLHGCNNHGCAMKFVMLIDAISVVCFADHRKKAPAARPDIY